MLTPILVGLPGAGKSKTTRILATETGLKYLSTDESFRYYRSIGIDTDNPDRCVMEGFLERTKVEFPDQFPNLLRAAQSNPEDTQKRSYLSDSKLFRSFGEDIFRTFETEMFYWLHNNNKFLGVIPDLSASAPLKDENRKIFSTENGYYPVLLDPPPSLLKERLFDDFCTFIKNGSTNPIRGGYEQAVLKHLGPITTAELESHKETIKDLLIEISETDRNNRMEKYRAFCKTSIPISDQTPAEIATEILRIVTLESLEMANY